MDRPNYADLTDNPTALDILLKLTILIVKTKHYTLFFARDRQVRHNEINFCVSNC